MKIFRSSSTLYFANVEMYAEALKKKVGEAPCSLSTTPTSPQPCQGDVVLPQHCSGGREGQSPPSSPPGLCPSCQQRGHGAVRFFRAASMWIA